MCALTSPISSRSSSSRTTAARTSRAMPHPGTPALLPAADAAVLWVVLVDVLGVVVDWFVAVPLLSVEGGDVAEELVLVPLPGEAVVEVVLFAEELLCGVVTFREAVVGFVVTAVVLVALGTDVLVVLVVLGTDGLVVLVALGTDVLVALGTDGLVVLSPADVGALLEEVLRVGVVLVESVPEATNGTRAVLNKLSQSYDDCDRGRNQRYRCGSLMRLQSAVYATPLPSFHSAHLTCELSKQSLVLMNKTT